MLFRSTESAKYLIIQKKIAPNKLLKKSKTNEKFLFETQTESKNEDKSSIKSLIAKLINKKFTSRISNNLRNSAIEINRNINKKWTTEHSNDNKKLAKSTIKIRQHKKNANTTANASSRKSKRLIHVITQRTLDIKPLPNPINNSIKENSILRLKVKPKVIIGKKQESINYDNYKDEYMVKTEEGPEIKSILKSNKR